MKYEYKNKLEVLTIEIQDFIKISGVFLPDKKNIPEIEKIIKDMKNANYDFYRLTVDIIDLVKINSTGLRKSIRLFQPIFENTKHVNLICDNENTLHTIAFVDILEEISYPEILINGQKLG